MRATYQKAFQYCKDKTTILADWSTWETLFGTQKTIREVSGLMQKPKIEHDIIPEKPHSKVTLFVRNLSHKVTEDDLRELFGN